MIYLNDGIKEDIARFDISEEELKDIINLSIADITNSSNALFIKNRKVLLLKRAPIDKLTTIEHTLTTKQLRDVSKKIIIAIEELTINKEFYKFFKRERFYKAIPVNFNDGKIQLKIINNTKASLYDFTIPIKSINFASMLNIKRKKFFTNNNIIYISIKDFNKETNIVNCSQFSKNIFISIFLEILDFLNLKQKKNYKLMKITVKFDERYKNVEYFPIFKSDKIVNGDFLSILSHFLEKKIGKVKLNVTYKQ